MNQNNYSSHQIEVAMLSDVGCLRLDNEDSIACIRPADRLLSKKKGLLAIIADGMGGHQSGEIASKMAIEIISRSYYRQYKDPLTALKKAFIDANTVIFVASEKNGELKGMGTTATALVIINNKAYFAHVGDTRIYWLRAGQIKQITEDNTMVNELVKCGVMKPEEAESHPQRNIITRAIGTHLELDLSVQGPFTVQSGDQYVLCSDGLHDQVASEEIKQAVLSTFPDKACEQLIELAKHRGGYDNISVGVLSVETAKDDVHRRIPITRFE